MANTYQVISWITRETLRVAHSNCVLSKGISRQYQPEFAQAGFKIGSVANIRLPIKVSVDNADNLNAQNFSETYTSITINQRWKAAFEFSTRDLTLSLDDIGKRVATPVGARLSGAVDTSVANMYPFIYNTVGSATYTPGLTTGGSAGNINYSKAPDILLHAQSVLDAYNAPRDSNRRLVLNPNAHAETNIGMSGMYNNQEQLGENFMNGALTRAQGFEIGSDQNINQTTCGTRAATGGTVSSFTTSTVTITGLASGATIEPGALFTMASVYGVNPESGILVNLPGNPLQNFVCTPNPSTLTYTNGSINLYSLTNGQYTADGTGTVTVNVSPSIIPSGTQGATVNVNPGIGAAVIFVGAANSTYINNLAYHQDGITMVIVDEFLPTDTQWSAREQYEGLSLRVWMASDPRTNSCPLRFDIIGGIAVVRPEFCVRVLG